MPARPQFRGLAPVPAAVMLADARASAVFFTTAETDGYFMRGSTANEDTAGNAELSEHAEFSDHALTRLEAELLAIGGKGESEHEHEPSASQPATHGLTSHLSPRLGKGNTGDGKAVDYGDDGTDLEPGER